MSMSAMAMAWSTSSSLNPNAPLFIPAAYRKVEDYSPEWWELVETTAWFRDHWFHQHQLYEAEQQQLHGQEYDDIAALLPDDSFDLLDAVVAEDLFYAAAAAKPAAGMLYGVGGDMDDGVLRSLSLNSPRALREQQQQQPRQRGEKPAQFFGGAKGAGAAARRVIHQPR